MSEEMIIKHCAPTLAGMKTANLFNCSFSCEADLKIQIEIWNRKLNPKGVYIKMLRKTATHALIYVYREAQLKKVIFNPEVSAFLKCNGYSKISLKSCIKELSNRLSHQEGFPHEIGIFLGYPFEDVKAFISNGGKNCKCVGCWKVYTDECSANRIFEKYKKCTKIYCKKYAEGSSILRLTVAA